MKKKGFTLLEIIVVTTLFAIVGLGVFSTFVSGLKMWNKVRNVNLVRDDVFIAMEKMAEEFRQSSDVSQIGFEGEHDWVSFPARLKDGLFRIGYLFDPENQVVLRRQVPLVDVEAEAKKGIYTGKQILAADRFSIEYFSFDRDREVYLWDNTWGEDRGPFSAVRFFVEKNEQTFSKTVFIPVAG